MAGWDGPIVTDSGAYIPFEEQERLGIHMVSARLNFGATEGLGPGAHSLSVCTESHAAETARALDDAVAAGRTAGVVALAADLVALLGRRDDGEAVRRALPW